MFASWPSDLTSVNDGSGFQMDGVRAPWATAGQPAAVWPGLASQSGWTPLCT